MAGTKQVVRTDRSRVFFIAGGAGPSHTPEYMPTMKAGAVRWAFGDSTPVEVPDPNRYGEFIVIDQLPAQRQNPQLPVTDRLGMELSALAERARVGCNDDIQVHIGTCENPSDFNRGWGKIIILEQSRISDYGTGELGALASSERATVDENATFSGQDYYEVGPMTYSEQAASDISLEGLSVVICDSVSCSGLCGIGSDGCQRVFVAMKAAAADDGPELIFSSDGGSTWAVSIMDSLAAAEQPGRMACAGANIIVPSASTDSHHYAAIADILAGTETWAEVTSGYTATKGPKAAFSLGSAQTWLVGEGGYIYFTSDPESSVVAQSEGGVTTQDLNAIHGIDGLNLVAVGAAGAVVYTTDGGNSWALATVPAATTLHTVWMKSTDVWFTGGADGNLYYTEDRGVTWSTKGFNGSGAGVVQDIVFATNSIGYLSHTTAAPAGRILRTLDGGNSWYVVPEGAGSLPVSDRITQLAVCSNPNRVFGAGLAGDGTDGIILKGA